MIDMQSFLWVTLPIEIGLVAEAAGKIPQEFTPRLQGLA
jgi:hypothetical protein